MANNWTYFILDHDTGLVKIGQSVNPFSRINAFRAEHPRVEIIAMFPDHSIERELHDKFAEWQVEGEWFLADEQILAYIKENQRLPEIIQGEPPLQPPPVIFTEPKPPRIKSPDAIDPRFDFAAGLLILVLWGAVLGIFAVSYALNGGAALTWRFALMITALPLAACLGPIKRHMARTGDV